MRQLFYFLSLSLVLTFSCCGAGHDVKHQLPDTIRVGTLYGPISYFIYRGDTLGYDYSLLQKLAADKGMVVKLEVAPSMSRLIEMADSGLIDLLATDIPVTTEYLNHIIPTGPETETTQVLVQRNGEEILTDVTELIGKDVYVEQNTKYHQRLINLNEELGGGINIVPIDRDTIASEELLEGVSNGVFPLTVVDSRIAQLNKTYFPNLDISLPISFVQKGAWGVTKNMPWLADSINAWLKEAEPERQNEELLKVYFEDSKITGGSGAYKFKKNGISDYDHLFKQYAPTHANEHYDWRLLAAQGFVESNFNPKAKSWAGARGLMQIMPRTARGYKLPMNQIENPEANVKAATALIADLDMQLSKYVSDPVERRKFVLAAYNGGVAHVLDAIRLAKKYGKDPTKWEGNVADALMMKSKRQYYTDPVVKFGYFRGNETVNYVRKVMNFYNDAAKSFTAYNPATKEDQLREFLAQIAVEFNTLELHKDPYHMVSTISTLY